MIGRFAVLSAALVLACSAARADLHLTTKQTIAGQSSVVEEYYKGKRWRRDLGRGSAYVVVDSEHRKVIVVDPEAREYSVTLTREIGDSPDPGRTIVVDSTTRDTGERKQLFGHPARHLITVEKTHEEAAGKPSSPVHESTIDGWYLDLPVPVPGHNQVGSIAVLTVLSAGGASKGPQIRRTQQGPAPNTLAVREKSGDRLSEVSRLSEAPLEDSLFEPPAAFRKVEQAHPGEQLSWHSSILRTLQQIHEWLGSL